MVQKNMNNQKQEDHDNGAGKKKYRSLTIDGTRYRTQLTEKFKQRDKWDNPHKGKVHSEFPGTVVKVDVEEGEEIEKGDRLYIYEAMKMKNRAYSPVGGMVKEVRIKEADIIRKGDLLFVIE
jgi:biotin carboxyl carrier protein